MKKIILTAAILSVSALPALALADNNLYGYGTVGTNGASLGLGTRLSERVGLRGEISYLDLTRVKLKDSTHLDYSGNLHAFNGGALVDFYPFRNSGWRLTGGAYFGHNQYTATGSTANNQITIDGTTYSLKDYQVKAKVTLPTVRPYIGVGYSHELSADKKWGFFADLGTIYGKPKSKFVSDMSFLPAPVQNIEQKALKKLVDKYSFWPVLRVGVQYNF